MQIQLKQAEIVTALKQYISQQGINLSGKTVDITFTAGRKEAGMSADISIEDIEIPGVSDGLESTKPALSVVKGVDRAPEPAASPAADKPRGEPAAAGQTPVGDPPPEGGGDSAVKSKSLFG